MRHWSGFDLLRLVAALCVVVSHALLLSGSPEPVPLRWGATPWSLGVCGVAVFFVVSGFLVSRSFDADPVLGRFALRRAARIWPALVAVVLLTALVIGTAVTSLSAREYLAAGGTWTYVARNLLLATELYLPGVFSENPSTVVNGSLWSLPLEVGCYLVVAGLGVTGLLRRRRVLLVLTAVVLAWAAAIDAGLLPPAGTGTLERLAPALVALFLLGMCGHAVGLPRSPWWAVAAVGTVLAVQVVHVPALGYAAFALLVLLAGTTSTAAASRLRSLGDPSYGTFLWGWPVSQLLVLAGVSGPVPIVAASAVLAVACGYASWWLIERRSLRAAHDRLGVTPGSPPPT